MSYIEIQQVSKQYANHKALNEVSLSIPKGSIYGLLGPNGAGKTTLIRIINCITAPDSGKVLINGEPLNASYIEKIGYLPEERGLYRKMKVGEQALYLAQLKGLSKDEALKRLKYWFRKFEIEAWWNKKVEELSKGMAQKVQFITTVLHEPELLIFDEPFSGFDPVNANLLKQEMLELRQKGATIIFSTHNMESVEELCDHISLINRSQVVLQGEVSEIRQRYKQHIYQVTVAGEFTPHDPNFEIVQQTQLGAQTQLRIKTGADTTANDLVRNIIAHHELIQFQEELPSMNDIFIQTVTPAQRP